MNDCPSRANGTHSFTYSVGGGTKIEYEPVEYGASQEDTRYKAVSYSYLACSCGQTMKKKVRLT